METNQAESTLWAAVRDNTDRSLEDERVKSDEYIDGQSKTIEAEATEAINSSRLAADKKRDLKRDEVDLAHSGSLLEADTLARERVRADQAQGAQRLIEDHARGVERFHMKLISEGLLAQERNATDADLKEERAQSEQQSVELLSEVTSHARTRTELITRDQYLAVVSHDLKNPIAAISMGASLIRRELAKPNQDPSKLLRHLELIELSSASMDRMTSDLLDVERMSSDKLLLKPQRVEIGSLLQECHDLFTSLVRSKGLTITVQTGPQPIFSVLDHDRILQVLSNLIGNALKFTPRDGTVGLYARSQDEEVEIWVTDDGPGIPEAKRTQIFERFAQLQSNNRTGLGLGLFISKWIIEAHNGRLWVISEPGKGSSFRFTLPAEPRAATSV